MTVDIYLREKDGNREIRIPILPEKIICNNGETKFVTYEIMSLGDVAVPSGTGLSEYSWSSEFPGEGRKNDPMIRGSWKDPKTYHNILEDWKEKGTKLNLIVTGYPINTDVYIKSYVGNLSGAFGDIGYDLALLKARDITIKTTQVETPVKRPTSTSSTYTIKPKDTLWKIAKKFYKSGTKWKTIYNANKDIIEKTAKKRGKKSSDNGHWIYPGVKLTIPGVSGSSSSGSSKKSSSSSSSKSSSGKASTEAYTAEYNAARQEAIKKYTNGWSEERK